MDDKYDEISGVINVYRDVQQLQQGIGRRERVKSKVLNIEAPAPLIRVKRDPYEIKEGDRYVTCSCGAPNPLQVSTCGKCSALLRTGLNKLGDKFRIGQNIVFLRNKTGVVDDGKIIFIHPVAPGEPEHVTVKVIPLFFMMKLSSLLRVFL